jgi:hypothetical protein
MPSFTDYIKKVQRLTKELESTKLLDNLSKDTSDFVKKYLDKGINISKGQVVIDNELRVTLLKLNNELNKYLNTNDVLGEYGNLVTNNLAVIGSLMEDFHATQERGYTDKTLKIKNQIVVDDFIQNVKGLNEAFVEPVRKAAVDNILNGKSYSDILKDMNEQIVGTGDKDGLMKRHLKTNARMAASAYEGAANQSFWNRYKDKITHVGVEGTLIETSAPQCVLSVQDYKGKVPINIFKNEVLPLAKKNGLIEDTDINNVWTNRLHWGCRHNFVPLIIK